MGMRLGVLAILLVVGMGTVSAEAEIRYRVVFDATWSAETHPGAYPGGAHFSPLIGVVHDEDAVFWEVGGLATSLHSGVVAFGNRVFAPGLPLGTLEGSAYTRLRGSLVVSFVPVKLFYERIQTTTDVADRSIDYAGLEFELNMDSAPVLRMPNLAITAGVSVAGDPPVEDELKGWFGLRWGR